MILSKTKAAQSNLLELKGEMKMTVYQWRVGWFERDRQKYRYFKTDYYALKKHLENLRKYGALLGGCSLEFKIERYASYCPVGGCDNLLGLTYGTKFLGKPKAYWSTLIAKAKSDLQSNNGKERQDNAAPIA